MKVVLSISSLVLIYLSSSLGLWKKVDYTGLYKAKNTSPKIILDQLQLNSDLSFSYTLISYESIVTTHSIKGTYLVKGKELRLSPSSFSNYINPVDQGARVKIRKAYDHHSIESKNHPKSFKKMLTAFESGTSRLQPKYHIKQLKSQLSLCSMDLRIEQYSPQFLKY